MCLTQVVSHGVCEVWTPMPAKTVHQLRVQKKKWGSNGQFCNHTWLNSSDSDSDSNSDSDFEYEDSSDSTADADDTSDDEGVSLGSLQQFWRIFEACSEWIILNPCKRQVSKDKILVIQLSPVTIHIGHFQWPCSLYWKFKVIHMLEKEAGERTGRGCSSI